MEDVIECLQRGSRRIRESRASQETLHTPENDAISNQHMNAMGYEVASRRDAGEEKLGTLDTLLRYPVIDPELKRCISI